MNNQKIIKIIELILNDEKIMKHFSEDPKKTLREAGLSEEEIGIILQIKEEDHEELREEKSRNIEDLDIPVHELLARGGDPTGEIKYLCGPDMTYDARTKVRVHAISMEDKSENV